MGKQRLARLLGVRTPTSRRLQERFRGETQGHGTHPDCVRVRQIKAVHPEWGAHRIAQALAISIDHAKLHLARYLGAQSGATQAAASRMGTPLPDGIPVQTELPADGSELQDTTQGDARDLSYRGTQIRSVDDLMVTAKIDTHIWSLSRHSLSMTERHAKNPVTGELEIQRFSLIRANLRRRTPELYLESVLTSMLDLFRKAAPERPAIVQRLPTAGMLEISIMDLHLGKFCSAAEGGRAYDPDIAERMYLTALDDLLAKASVFKPERILLPTGNDFLNTDSLGRMTTAGTLQDESITWKESFLRGRLLLIKAIDRLRQIAPVDVVMIPGNHDSQRLYYLGQLLEAWFHRTADVHVECCQAPRHYVVYGRNLIGFAHGHNERHDKLPIIMATERPTEWGMTTHREYHLGHLHSKQLKMFVPTADHQGVLVRIIPSLCPPDSWHAAMGYSGKLGAEAYYWDSEQGCVATFTHSPA